jgi:hypothetical protein
MRATILFLSSLFVLTRTAALFAQPADLSDEAFARYEAGDYPGAVSLYMQAYERSVDSRILFNVAQIYDKKVQDRDLAVEYYRRYLKSTTTEPELVATATARITDLLRQPEIPSSPPPAPAVPGEAPKEPALSDSPARPEPKPDPDLAPPAAEPPVFVGWIVTGVLGAAGVGTGVGALLLSSDLRDTTYRGDPTEESQADADRVAVLAGVTDGLLAGALVAGAVTLIVQLTHSPTRPQTALWLSPDVSGGRRGVMLGGSF